MTCFGFKTSTAMIMASKLRFQFYFKTDAFNFMSVIEIYRNMQSGNAYSVVCQKFL